MRYPRLALFSLPICAVALALSGCSSSLMSPSSNPVSNSGSGAAPVVVAIGDQVNGVAPNRKQEVQFSEAMDPSTINAQTFQVSDSSGKLAPGIVSYDPDFNIASFLPDPALQAGAAYTATITTSAASTGGVHLASAYSYAFTTRSDSDTSPLIVNSVNPAANATCVSASTAITITFDEAPDASTVVPGNFMVSGPNGAISVKISFNVATTQVVLTPASTLPSGTITVTVNNVADLAGVKMAAPYTWTFSTACSGGGGGGANTFVYAGNLTNIAGFAIAADGSAVPVPGSPFALGGSGLAASPSGNFVFGSGQGIFTYAVGANGSLSTGSSTTQIPSDPVTGAQVPSGSGAGWLATDPSGSTLYGGEANGSPSTGDQWMSEYAIGSSGSLSLLGAIDTKDVTTRLYFTSDSRYAYSVASPPMQNPSAIDYVTRNADGTLINNGGLNLPLPAGVPLGANPGSPVPSPNSNYLVVPLQQNGFGGGGSAGGIAVYSINNDGTVGAPTPFLNLITSGGVPGASSLVWDSSGKYLFASSAGTIYEIRFDSSSNTATLAGTTTYTTDTATATDRISYLNGHLFIVHGQNLYVYNFSNGVLTPAPSSPVSLGFTPSSIAALQH